MLPLFELFGVGTPLPHLFFQHYTPGLLPITRA